MNNILGNTYNRLTILEFSHHDKNHRKHFKCCCSCGTTKTIQGSLVKSGNTKSCGCLAKEIRALKLLPNSSGTIHQIILQYKRHARDRNLTFILTTAQFTILIFSPCHYCGANSTNLIVTKNCKAGLAYNGIDRVDNNKGYTVDNTVSCCKTCNIAKGTQTKTDFIAWATKVTFYQEQSNRAET